MHEPLDCHKAALVGSLVDFPKRSAADRLLKPEISLNSLFWDQNYKYLERNGLTWNSISVKDTWKLALRVVLSCRISAFSLVMERILPSGEGRGVYEESPELKEESSPARTVNLVLLI